MLFFPVRANIHKYRNSNIDARACGPSRCALSDHRKQRTPFLFMRHLCCSCCISNYQTIWAQHCNSNSISAMLPVVQGRADRWLCLLGCRGHLWLLLICLSGLGFYLPGPSKAPGLFVTSGHACVKASDGRSSLYGRPGGYNLISE